MGDTSGIGNMSSQCPTDGNMDDPMYEELCIDNDGDAFVNNTTEHGLPQNLSLWPNAYPVVWPISPSEDCENEVLPSENSSDRGSADSANPQEARSRTSSLVNGLLTELYDTYRGGFGTGRWQYQDSVDSSTEASGSDAFLSRSNPECGFLQELSELQGRRHQIQFLKQKGECAAY